MRAINHSLTGALIGLTISQPVIAIPLALASHFVLDAVPHFDITKNKKQWIASKRFRYLLYLDAALCFMLVVTLFANQPVNWLLASVCAFVAAAPDLISIDYYRHVLGRKKWQPSLYSKFAHKIQWFERPIGAVVEIAWFAASLFILAPLLV